MKMKMIIKNEKRHFIGVSGDVKYNIDDYKNNSNSINIIKGK